MQIIIRSHHVEVTDALKQYAEKKMEKLEIFFDHIQSIEIHLNMEASSAEEDRQEASAIIKTDGGIITAKEASASMYASIDILIDKLKVQLKKLKEKLHNHKGHGTKRDAVFQYKKEQRKENTYVKEQERYIPKPMDIEDAVRILQEEALRFLVFRDLNEKVCVVYPTADQEYGVIQT